jgi:hypothetical protein
MSPDLNSNRTAEPVQPSTQTSPTQSTPSLRDKLHNSIGFLGPTSFTAVFLENHESSNIPQSLNELSAGREPIIVSDADLQEGAEVLLVFLRCLPLCSKLHRRLYSAWDVGVVHEILVETWHTGAGQLFGDIDVEAIGSELLEKCQVVSEKIWQNSNIENVINEDTTMQLWAKCFTGQQLRWEVIGTVSLHDALTSVKDSAVLICTDIVRGGSKCK